MSLAYNREMLRGPADTTTADTNSSHDAKVDAEAAEAWRAEIYRRIREIDSGRTKLTPWPEVQRDLRARLWK